MRVLLVGPFPPPYGGISVHVSHMKARLLNAGIDCRVVNMNRSAADSAEYLKVAGALPLFRTVLQHAWRRWTIHVHTNGHNIKSWLVAFVCGVAGRCGPSQNLTLHSGMAPDFITGGTWLRRAFIAGICAFFKQITCVSPAICDAVEKLGVNRSKIVVSPAYFPTKPTEEPLPEFINSWVSTHHPLLATTLSFRPEYGFEVLAEAVRALRQRYPRIGCVVMGDSQNRSAVEPYLAGLSISQNVLLAGDVGHAVCLKVISAAAAFVRPTFTDGDSISVREALELGTPTVASAVGLRPAGVILFPAGNADALARKLGSILQ